MKKVVIGILVILVGVAVWFLMVKEHDHVITFNANASQSSVYNHVKDAKFIDTTSIQDNAIITDKVLFESFKQEVLVDNQKVILDWKFKAIADTITKVNVGIITTENTIKHRLQALFKKSPLVKTVKDELILFRWQFGKYTNMFKVTIDGESEMPAMEIMTTNAKVKRDKKATAMMKANSYLYPKLAENGITQDGLPFVNIKNWNTEEDTITFDFGIPIAPKDTLPDTIPNIVFGNIKSQKALKATFYGNYAISDEAWFALLDYAKRKNIKLDNKPFEVFHNNPMAGGNQLEWKAEIFVPILEN